MFSPILRNNLTVFTALVQCTDLLPTVDTVEMELQFRLNRVNGRKLVELIYKDQ
jgi:hypothetical protein